MNSIEIAKNVLSTALFVPESNIGDDDLLNSIKGMDSLAFEGMILEVERLTGHEPDPLRLLEIQTVSDLALLIKEMQSA